MGDCCLSFVTRLEVLVVVVVVVVVVEVVLVVYYREQFNPWPGMLR